MFKRINKILIIICFFTQIGYAAHIDNLLNELARKDDLSVHTKKESAGYLTIFTRQDLDRMKIRSLKELIEKIPFIRYNENSSGLSAPFYEPYQANNPSRIRIYINDRELLSPLFGSGLQLFGQIDMAYIDHIEVYTGLPSYDISIEPVATVIKLYTKTGKRENTSVVGLTGGTYGTSDAYAYTSEALKDYSYFAYFDHRNLKREKLHHLGSTLSRDKQSGNFYAQITMPTSRFEVQVAKGTMKNFMGDSWNITPNNPNTDFQYLYAGYNYNSLDKSLKGYVNYSNLSEKNLDSSNAHIGVLPAPPPYFYSPYDSRNIKTKEQLLDTQVTKKFYIGQSSYLFGLRNRFKKFVFDSNKIDGVEIPLNTKYNSEDMLSIFSEMDYSLNNKNRLILSASAERYIENGGIKSETIFGTRIGHIYTSGNFSQKSFFFYGKFRPTPYELLTNDQFGSGILPLNSEKAYAISTKSSLNYKNGTVSLLLARTIMDNSIYFNGQNYTNLNKKYTFDSISFKNIYRFNDLDKIEFNAWVLFDDYGKNTTDRYDNQYGGYVAFFKKLGKVDTYNSLSYRDGYGNVPAGWNYNVTLTYPYSRKLSFYVKGENLLNKALKTDYLRINPLTTQVTRLNNVSTFDRTIWVGLEYEF